MRMLSLTERLSKLPKVTTSSLIPVSEFPNTNKCPVLGQRPGVVNSRWRLQPALTSVWTQQLHPDHSSLMRSAFPGPWPSAWFGLLSDIRIPNTYWGGVNRTPRVTQIAGCVTCVSPTHVWGGLHTAARRADNRKQMQTFLPTDSQPASPGVCFIITFVPERELED